MRDLKDRKNMMSDNLNLDHIAINVKENGINLTSGWYDEWYSQTLIRLKTQKNPKNRSL